MGSLIIPSESLSTINIIPGYFLGRLPILLLIGFLLLVFSLFIYWLARRNGKINYRQSLLNLFFVFWLIIFIWFTLGNYYDFQKNKYYSQYDLAKKQIIRVCDLDTVQAKLCRLFSFISSAQTKVPSDSHVEIVSDPISQTYLTYYIFPQWLPASTASRADYLFLYDDRVIIKLESQ